MLLFSGREQRLESGLQSGISGNLLTSGCSLTRCARPKTIILGGRVAKIFDVKFHIENVRIVGDANMNIAQKNVGTQLPFFGIFSDGNLRFSSVRLPFSFVRLPFSLTYSLSAGNEGLIGDIRASRCARRSNQTEKQGDGGRSILESSNTGVLWHLCSCSSGCQPFSSVCCEITIDGAALGLSFPALLALVSGLLAD